MINPSRKCRLTREGLHGLSDAHALLGGGGSGSSGGGGEDNGEDGETHVGLKR